MLIIKSNVKGEYSIVQLKERLEAWSFTNNKTEMTRQKDLTKYSKL